MKYYFRRGFIWKVECSIVQWCGGECPTCGGWAFDTLQCARCNQTGRVTGIGPQIVRRHPVERVVLTDREPLRVGENWYAWHFADHGIANNTTTLPARMLWGGRTWGEIVGDLPGFKHVNTDRNGNVVRIHFNSKAEAIDSASRLATAWAKSQPDPARIQASPVSVDVTA